MTRNRPLSPVALDALAVMAAAGKTWSHGYDLCRRTGIKSGTLYPLLIRLQEQGYLEDEWQACTEPGRPPRHAYRLTPAGHRFAQANAAAESSTAVPARSERFA